MQCLFCGKPIGLLLGLAESEFCCRDHRKRYRSLTRQAFARLGESRPEPVQGPPPAIRFPQRHTHPNSTPHPAPAGWAKPPSPQPLAAFERTARITGPAGLIPIAQMLLRAPETPAPRVALAAARALPLERHQPVPASSVPAALAGAEPVFSKFRPALATLAARRVESLDVSLEALTRTESHRPCLDAATLAPRSQEVLSTRVPSNGVAAEIVSMRPSLATVRSWLDLAEKLPLASHHTPAPSMVRPMARAASPVENLTPARPAVLPRMTAAEPEAPPAAARAGFVAPAPHLALMPLPVTPAALPPIAAAAARIEAIRFPMPTVALPALRARLGEAALKPKESFTDQVALADIVNGPVAEAEAPGLGTASVLPALASLFRYNRPIAENSPLPALTPGLSPQNRLATRAAYRELPMPSQRPRVPKSSGLRIVETFEYLRPMEDSPLDLVQHLIQFWRTIPGYVRYASAAVCVMLLLVTVLPGGMFSNLVVSRWDRLQAGISERAAAEYNEDFRQGMSGWTGEGDWAQSWRLSQAGYVKPGRLALFQPSMNMKEYTVEFMFQIEQRSVGFAYRATDRQNYYATKISIARPGPLPELSLIRYPVIAGREGPKVEVPIRVLMHNDTPYRVQLTVNGKGFSTSIEGQLVDFWSDERLKVGGFGFFSDTGESARVYWMKLAHQNDFVGRICAYARATDVDRRSSMRSQ